jgi:hypothetical protein
MAIQLQAYGIHYINAVGCGAPQLAECADGGYMTPSETVLPMEKSNFNP